MQAAIDTDSCYSQNAEGIYIPHDPVRCREEEYDPAGFPALRDMQERHFWYQGRHRFLHHRVRKEVLSCFPRRPGLQAVDIGGGCGGWIKYLTDRSGDLFGELAMADASCQALQLAEPILGPGIKRYQIDLLDLHWHERWDAAFLLDVLEHIPADLDALCQVREALRPGGLVFVTTPALRWFWSYNDDLAHHVRRYSRRDFHNLAEKTGFELRYAGYFMFFLSPLLLLSRLKRPNLEKMSAKAIQEHLNRTHQVPSAPLNQALRLVFALETPLGAWLPFPWGTSILGVFRKKACSRRGHRCCATSAGSAMACEQG